MLFISHVGADLLDALFQVADEKQKNSSDDAKDEWDVIKSHILQEAGPEERVPIEVDRIDEQILFYLTR